jgi:hypothetical protein
MREGTILVVGQPVARGALFGCRPETLGSASLALDEVGLRFVPGGSEPGGDPITFLHPCGAAHATALQQHLDLARERLGSN